MIAVGLLILGLQDWAHSRVAMSSTQLPIDDSRRIRYDTRCSLGSMTTLV
jgi:hypothetical protein